MEAHGRSERDIVQNPVFPSDIRFFFKPVYLSVASANFIRTLLYYIRTQLRRG
jgi:hypothetical protein